MQATPIKCSELQRGRAWERKRDMGRRESMGVKGGWESQRGQWIVKVIKRTVYVIWNCDE